ncbi:hypothetical protein [Litoreibacter janthinus]|uniref:Uncharacterized protein n=1 Tax=Litoreibacter janthinus TaxID=670154 RepID=A0A1I6G1H7_9RHOB|nr:hypothetical protein [Litoreibacter janthinus]SFR36038.1 hypothetical protein SAMN04488002_0736 [Litoreibacter janthinus]
MKRVVIVIISLGVIAAAAWNWGGAIAQHGMMSGHHGGNAQTHDEVRMPMLNGRDTTPEEVEDLRALFTEHRALTRSVTNLPNGIRTLTETKDPALLEALFNHAVGMIDRVDSQRDPQVPIQSPTLDYLFAHPDRISTEIEPTDFGLIVTQTSDDPKMVEALQTHAAEVSDLAARGMQSVHESMMGRHHTN